MSVSRSEQKFGHNSTPRRSQKLRNTPKFMIFRAFPREIGHRAQFRHFVEVVLGSLEVAGGRWRSLEVAGGRWRSLEVAGGPGQLWKCTRWGGWDPFPDPRARKCTESTFTFLRP